MKNNLRRYSAILLTLVLALSLIKPVMASETAGVLAFEERAFSDHVSEAVIHLDHGVTIRASRVKLPRVLGESEVADYINGEIDAIERALVTAYNTAARERNAPGPVARYDVYFSTSTVSLVVTYRLPREREEALVYNIDLETSELLSQAEFAQKVLGAELDPWLVTENVRLAAQRYHRYARPTAAAELVAQSLTLHNENPQGTRIFAYDSGRIGFIYPLRMESGGQRLTVAEFNSQLGPAAMAPDFASLAQAFEMDAEGVQAFVIPLGWAYDSQSMRSLVFALFNGMETYHLNEVPSYYARMDGDRFAASEHYYIVPKDRHAIVKVTALDFSEDEAQPVPNPNIPVKEFSGPVFISMNESDIMSNVEITLGDLQFSPYISLKDGTLVLPEGVKELRFAWEKLNEAQDPAPFSRLWEDEILPKVATLGE